MLDRNLLKAAIARAGMTQEKLAKAIGINGNTLSAKILGRSYFDTEEIDKICDVLSIVDNNEKADIFLASPSRFGMMKQRRKQHEDAETDYHKAG